MSAESSSTKPGAVLQMSVRVSDGSFESSMSVPVDASKEQIDRVAQMWIQALGQAVALTRGDQ